MLNLNKCKRCPLMENEICTFWNYNIPIDDLDKCLPEKLGNDFERCIKRLERDIGK